MVYLHKLQDILKEEYEITQTQKKMAAKKVASGLTGQVDNYEVELREAEIQIHQRQLEQRHSEAHLDLVKIYGEDLSDSQLSKLQEFLFSGVVGVGLSSAAGRVFK